MKTLFSILVVLALIPLSGCFKTRAEIAREREEKEVQSNMQQNIVESSEAMNRLQAENGRLQGRIEELEHQRKKEMSTLYSSKEGTDKNVNELKSKLDELQKAQLALFEEMKKLKEENIQLVKASGEKPKSSSSGSKKNAGNSFEGGVSAYKSKDFDSAADAFRAYLAENPKSKKAMDAHFLLGESLFKTKKYNEAIVEFSVPQEKSPKSTMGRKSALRIAESFKAMGKDKDAKAFAQILIESNPGSEEAKAAKRFLK